MSRFVQSRIFYGRAAPGETVAMVASVESWELLTFETQVIVEAERQRLTKLLARVPASEQDDFVRQLVLAVDQFIVLPGSRPEEDVLARASGDEARTVIAGYHWFGDWGRDTMISLEGLTMCTGGMKKPKRFCAPSRITLETG